jgi:hypothetical protein
MAWYRRFTYSAELAQRNAFLAVSVEFKGLLAAAVEFKGLLAAAVEFKGLLAVSAHALSMAHVHSREAGPKTTTRPASGRSYFVDAPNISA